MIAVQRIEPSNWGLAYPLIAQLRKLDEAEFLHLSLIHI